jgi:hypothetical protein
MSVSMTMVDLKFKSLTREQLAALMALTKDLGHDRVVDVADSPTAGLSPLMDMRVKLTAAEKKIEAIKDFVDAQAQDEGLWAVAQYASEAYIQDGLRGLHAYIESVIKDGPRPIADKRDPEDFNLWCRECQMPKTDAECTHYDG